MESLAQRNEAAGEDDDRNVADLLLDQIEFADVLVLNKCDLISTNEAQRLESLLKTLNPGAEVILATNSQVPIPKVINTGRFNFEKAAQSAGWLKSLQENLVPETEEYGIGSFVFRSRKPFHPARLYAFMSTYFCLQEPDWKEAMGLVPENEEEEGVSAGLIAVPIKEPLTVVRESAMSAADAAENAAKALRQLCSLDDTGASDSRNELINKLMMSAAVSAASAASAASSCAAMILAMEMTTTSSKRTKKTVADDDDVFQQRRQQLHESFGQLLRSKGFVWVATRRDLCGEWSQAGGVLRFTVGGPWYAALPEEAWPQSSEERRVVQQDFDGPDGDRRQELVFIGIDLKKDALISALNACLVSEEEEKHLAQLPDPFAVWPSLDQILGDTETVETTPEATVSPGVIEIEGGAAQVQSILDNKTDSAELCIVQWHAPWCEPSDRACVEFERLAKSHPHITMLRVNVDASPANTFLAMEKVMEKPNARRDGAKPVLRMGRKFPAFTVHHPPDLQPVDIVSGPEFLCRLEEIIGLREPSAVNNSFLSTSSNAVEVLTAGASQLKAVLTKASLDGEIVVVLWIDDNDALNKHSLQSAHRAPNGMNFTLVQANISATPQNAVLAKALKVAVVPTFHVYRHMKLEQRLEGDKATVQQLHKVLEDHKKEKVANKDAPSENMSDELDPPSGKYAKPGATKRLADGRTAHFFPKMPCLRCGCPWWSSEEWNGRCVRCGWDCEKQGYDDDSRPLPAYQKKWESFTDLIRQGRTPQWTSRRR